MTLASGSRFGSFEVIGPLGTGGMGEVYRARDTRLNRDVAIKVLPATLTHDSQRVARFRREAQVLASLNHPNIGGIHGLEEDGAVTALILELVEGPTLADRIARGPLPVDETLAIAAQIARALEAAHERGIIHRDLKPANIKLKADGTVKVLDFGLAKATEPTSAVSDVSDSPTVTATGAGLVLGTAAYMSPEQARGQPVDTRSDVWAFGCVVYEMLTGTRAFTGEHVSDVLANVIKTEPNWAAMPTAATSLVRVLQRCLDKDVSQRLRSIADAQLLLTDAAAVPAEAAPTSARSMKIWLVAATAAVAGAVAASAAIALLKSSSVQTASAPVRRYELKFSASDPLASEAFGTSHFAISPDGSRIVYESIRRGTPQLVVRRLDQVDSAPIAGTEDGFNPFFSPDGQQLGFSTFTELKKVPIAGGPTVTLCPIDAYFNGASWNEDNTIIFGAGALGLFRVPAAGGKPERLALPDAGKNEQGFSRPIIVPGGRAILYNVVFNDGSKRIAGRRLDSNSNVTVVDGAFGPHILFGRLIYAQGNQLMAAALDASTLTLTSAPVPLPMSVLLNTADGITNIGAAADGTLAVLTGRDVSNKSRLLWVDWRGTQLGAALSGTLEFPRFLSVSPDGRRLAVTVGPPAHAQIWIYDLNGASPPTKLTFDEHDLFPTWSPDGKRVAFMSRTSSASQLWWIPADGSTVQATPLTHTDFWGPVTAWGGSDSNTLLVTKQPESKIYLLQLTDGSTRPWLSSPFSESGGSLSPDGRWVAFASNQTGAWEIWVRPFPGPGVPTRISTEGGQKPVWSRDGKDIFFEKGERLFVARVKTLASEFQAEKPEIVLQGGFVHDDSDPNIRFFDSAPGGRLLIVEAPPSMDASLVVAPHWDAELNRLLQK